MKKLSENTDFMFLQNIFRKYNKIDDRTFQKTFVKIKVKTIFYVATPVYMANLLDILHKKNGFLKLLKIFFNSIQFMFICCTYQYTVCSSYVHDTEFWCSFHLWLIYYVSIEVIRFENRLNMSRKNLQKNCYFCLRRG